VNASTPVMERLLNARASIDAQFHGSSAGPAHFFLDQNADDYAAYYTSMYLIQDTGEAIYTHAKQGFAASTMAAYIEFWGVMQATQIQQDAIIELHGTVVGQQPGLSRGPGWNGLRDFRNLVAGHPANRSRGVPATQRAFMGRTLYRYDHLTYEMFDAAVAGNPPRATGVLGPTSHHGVDLRQMIHDYESEAVAILGTVLGSLRARWP
jgi:hypothetical protein